MAGGGAIGNNVNGNVSRPMGGGGFNDGGMVNGYGGGQTGDTFQNQRPAGMTFDPSAFQSALRGGGQPNYTMGGQNDNRIRLTADARAGTTQAQRQDMRQDIRAGMQQPAPMQPAPMQPNQTPAMTTQPAGPNVFDQSAGALQGGMNAASNVANYAPTSANLQPYMNPYQRSVTDATMNGLRQQQQQTMNGLDAQASGAGAFGGSRHGIAMGETNGQYADTQAQTLAGLNSQNYNQALGAQQATQGLNLQGAGQLGNLSNLGFSQGMQINGQQASQGAQQQAMQQQLVNAALEQFRGLTGAPMQSAQIMNGGVNNVPYSTTGTATQTQTPGLFDWLSLGLSV